MKTWVAIALATAGLSFQAVVLHPWHESLTTEFREIKTRLHQIDKERIEERKRREVATPNL